MSVEMNWFVMWHIGDQGELQMTSGCQYLADLYPIIQNAVAEGATRIEIRKVKR